MDAKDPHDEFMEAAEVIDGYFRNEGDGDSADYIYFNQLRLEYYDAAKLFKVMKPGTVSRRKAHSAARRIKKIRDKLIRLAKKIIEKYNITENQNEKTND